MKAPEKASKLTLICFVKPLFKVDYKANDFKHYRNPWASDAIAIENRPHERQLNYAVLSDFYKV